MGFRIEAPKQDGNARFNTLKVNLNENNLATRVVVADEQGNFYYGSGGGGGTGGTNGTSGANGSSGTSGTGFNTISNPAPGRVLLSDGSTNSAIASTNLNFSNNTLQVTGSLIADSLLINSDVFEFTGSLRVLGGITGSLQGTASWAINALTASSADGFIIRSDKFEFTGSLEVLGGITGSLFGTASWAVSASWAPGAGQSDTASYVSSSNVYGPYGFDSIRTASYALTASSADTFLIRSDVFEFTGSVRVQGGITGSLLGTASYAPNIYNSDGELTGNRIISASFYNLTINSTKSTGSTFIVSHIQTQSNATDTADIGMQVAYNISASSATNQLVSRAFQLSVSNNLTGGGALQNLRCFNLAAFFGTGTTTTEADLVYLERGNLTGTISTYRAIRIANYTGTQRAGIVMAAIGATNSVYLNLGSVAIPSGRWGVYQSETAVSNYFAGDVSIGTTQTGSYKLHVVGSTGISNGLTATGSIFFPSLIQSPQSSVVLLNASTGQLYYTSSAALIPLTASYALTASQALTASHALTASSADTFLIRSDVFEFTGSVRVQGGITGSLLGTSSFAITASHALNVPVTASHSLVASSSIVTNTTTGTGPFYLTFVDEISGSRPLRVDSNTLTFNASTNVLTATSSYALNAGSVFPFSGSAVITGSLVITGSSTNSTYLLNAPGTVRFKTIHVENLKNPDPLASGKIDVFVVNNPGDAAYQKLSIFAGGSPYSTVLQTSGDGGGSRGFAISAGGPGGEMYLVTSDVIRWTITGTYNALNAGHLIPGGDSLYNIGDPTAKVANYYGVRSYISNLLSVTGSASITGSLSVAGVANVTGSLISNDATISGFSVGVSSGVGNSNYITKNTATTIALANSSVAGGSALWAGTNASPISRVMAMGNGDIWMLPSTGVVVGGTTYAGFTFDVQGSARTTNGLKVTGSTIISGDLGVGTPSPTYKLDVAGAISMHDEAQDLDSRYYNGTFLRGWSSFNTGNESNITYTTDTTSPVGTEVLSVSSYIWPRGPKIRLDKTQNYEVEFWVKRHTAGTAGTLYMVVSNYDSSGNVISGDGTDWNYPLSGLDQSTLTVGTWYKYRYIVGPYGGAKDHSSSARYISIGFIANYTTGTDTMYLTGFKCRPIPAYNNDALTIQNNGNVGIKTTGPAYALDVTGTIRATGDVIAFSDARVKDNVEIIENALEKVTSLRGVSYTRKDTDDKSRKLGVIAQEVLPIIPEVVSKDQHGNYSVSYGNIVGLLIEAIKEQQQQIEELKYLLKKE